MTSRDGVPDADDLDWRGYEELVKNISAALGRKAGVEVVCWGRNCCVEGPPGTRHQIDVLTRHSEDQQQYLTGISCKWTKDKVDLSHVREMAYIVHATDLTKSIIVSKNGYTEPARGLARSENIGLFELRKPTDEDWGDSITDIRGSIILDPGPVLRDVRFRGVDPPPDSDAEVVATAVAPREIQITIPGRGTTTLSSFALDLHAEQPDQTHFDHELPVGTVVTAPIGLGRTAETRTVRGVSFRLEPLPPLTTEVRVRAEDVIYMIMRDVFTDQQHNITTNGQIVEAI